MGGMDMSSMMGGMGGGGMGAGAWSPAPIPIPTSEAPPSMSKEEEVKMLKQQAEAMTGQVQEIQERIRQLEDGEGA